MFDFDDVVCELPVGYAFEFDKGDDMYVLNFGNQQLGSFYHYIEMVEAAINHYIEWKAANLLYV